MTCPKHYDVVVIGAGPSGCSAALHLADSGLKVAIIDKAQFPRDKVCGDGLSLKTIQALEQLPGNFMQKFLDFPRKIKSQRARFIAYNDSHVDRHTDYPDEGELTGYVCRRYDFDYLLVEHLKAFSNITLIEKCNVTGVKADTECIKVTGKKGVFTAKIVVGAFGVNIKLSRLMTGKRYARRDLAYAYRTYIKDVGGFRWDNAIELYFFDDISPGFVWLFPLENNTINAGLGLKSTNLKKRIRSPEIIFEKFIRDKSSLTKRFKDAEMISSFRGAPLALGKRKRPVSGERFILTGDAASLVDSLTGEGICNALRSGGIAAEQILTCFESQNFSAEFLKSYDKALYSKLFPELKQSKITRFMIKNFDLISHLTNSSYRFKDFLSDLSVANWDEEARKRVMSTFRIF